MNDTALERARTSAEWCDYFRSNSLPDSELPVSGLTISDRAISDQANSDWAVSARAVSDLPWGDAYRLTPRERSAIEKSIQQFQLGEGSEGRRLLQRGEAYAREAGDADFVAALTLLIGEEQRHSAHLGRFMKRQGIPIVTDHWVDTVFRRLRVLAGLELSLTVLVTAELIAVPYYRALREATA